LLVAAFLLIM